MYVLEQARLILVCSGSRTVLYEARDPTPKDASAYRRACEIRETYDRGLPTAVCTLPGRRLCASITRDLRCSDLVVYQLPPPPPATTKFTADTVLIDPLKVRSAYDAGTPDTNRSWAGTVRPRNGSRATATVHSASPPPPASDSIPVPTRWHAPLTNSEPRKANALLSLPPPYEHVIICANISSLSLFDTHTLTDGDVKDQSAGFPSLVWYSCSEPFSETTGPTVLCVWYNRLTVWQIVRSTRAGTSTGSSVDGGGVLVLKQLCSASLSSADTPSCVVLSDKRIVVDANPRVSVYTFNVKTNQLNCTHNELPLDAKTSESTRRRTSGMTVLSTDDIVTGEEVLLRTLCFPLVSRSPHDHNSSKFCCMYQGAICIWHMAKPLRKVIPTTRIATYDGDKASIECSAVATF